VVRDPGDPGARPHPVEEEDEVELPDLEGDRGPRAREDLQGHDGHDEAVEEDARAPEGLARPEHEEGDRHVDERVQEVAAANAHEEREGGPVEHGLDEREPHGRHLPSAPQDRERDREPDDRADVQEGERPEVDREEDDRVDDVDEAGDDDRERAHAVDLRVGGRNARRLGEEPAGDRVPVAVDDRGGAAVAGLAQGRSHASRNPT
jgi:hypothetical protein